MEIVEQVNYTYFVSGFFLFNFWANFNLLAANTSSSIKPFSSFGLLLGDSGTFLGTEMIEEFLK